MTTGPEAGARHLPGLRRGLAVAAALVLATVLLWWAVGRLTAEGRRLVVRHAEVAAPDAGHAELRVVAWNIAHGRGDDTTGWFAHWTAGSPDERRARLLRMGAILRAVEADVVVLNEVDFDAAWSGGVNQAEVLARAAGYPTWVEQRNVDLRLPFATFGFGNAVLTRLPVLEAGWLELPARSRLESILAGAKASATVRLHTTRGPVTVVPVHLEFRAGPTRRSAVSVFDSVRLRDDAPVVLAGDFNAAPPGWSGSAGPTVVGDLLDLGWRSPRARAGPTDEGLTWPTKAPRRALDWILVGPPLQVVESRVLDRGSDLSDHAPVLSVIRLPSPVGPPDTVSPAAPAARRPHVSSPPVRPSRPSSFSRPPPPSSSSPPSTRRR